MNDHPTEADLQRLLAGNLEPEECRLLVRKLLGGCSPRVTPGTEAFLLGEAEKPDLPDLPRETEWHYEASIRRAEEGAPRIAKWLVQERKILAQGLAVMRACPGGWREMPDREKRKIHGWPRLEMLLEAAYAVRYSNPNQMLWLAMSAKGVAEHLDVEKYGSALVADLQARAWAEFGNAQRVNLQLSAADASFAEAWERFADGSGDVELEARLNSLEASLRRAQRRIREALSLLKDAQRLYRELGDDHLAGRIVVQRGQVLLDEGRDEEAILAFKEALPLLDCDRDSELAGTCILNLVATLAQAGEHKEAGRLLMKSGLREVFANKPLSMLKLRWAEAKILLARGNLERAGEVFSEVREEFTRLDQHYDAALVGLDEAAFWLSEGDVEAVEDIAAESYQTFLVLQIFPEATKALYFLREACRYEVVSEEILASVRSFFLRALRDPRARFEVPE